MEQSIFIKAISYYLPEKVLTNSDIHNEFPEWSVEKVASKIGVSQRHIVAEDETALDMAEKAAIKLFEEYKIDKSSIDYILLCTQSPDYFLPTSACILQHKLGLPTKCGALDFNLGCSGYIYGLTLAKGLIAASIAENVLLLTSETYTKHLHPSDKSNRTIFGDAASATLVSTDGFGEILNFSLGTDGTGAENLIVKAGGMRNRKPSPELSKEEVESEISHEYLFMNGPEIFNFTGSAVPLLVEDVLSKNNIKKDDVDLFIFHQANRFMLEFLQKKIKIPQNSFYYYMDKVGNTVSSTIPIALKEALVDNQLKGNVLLAGFGVGYSWGGVIIYCR